MELLIIFLPLWNPGCCCLFPLYYVTGLAYAEPGTLTPAFGVWLDDTLPTWLAFSPSLLPQVQMNTCLLRFPQRSELL